MPSTKQLDAYVAQTYATKASPAFTGTMTIPSGTNMTSPNLTTPAITAPTGSGFVRVDTVAFVENATNTTHTGTVTLPAGSTLLDVQVTNTVLWTGGTATFKAGDTDDDDGFFIGIDCKATDLLVGEVLSMASSENWGGKQGAYLNATTGRKGSVAAGVSGNYYGVTKDIIGTMTVGTPATTAGRSFMTVIYMVGKATVATATGP